MKGNKFKRVSIRKNHLWVTILLFLIMSVVLVAVFILSLFLFSSSLINSKLSGEITAVCEETRVFQMTSEDLSIDRFYAEYDMDCFVRDDSGVLSDLHGENTCDSDHGYEYRLSGRRPISCMVYPDTQDTVLRPDEENIIDIDYFEFFSMAAKAIRGGAINRLFRQEMNGSFLDLPIWVSVKLNDSKTLYIKRYVSVNTDNVIAMLGMLVIVGIIYLVIFTVLLINAIRNILAQRRLTKALFTDAVTGDKNKTWFLVKGEKLLRKSSNAPKKYAVYSILFVKYLNFCISHSIAEGETLLCNICNQIKTAIGKKDICVHYDSSDIAVLVELDPNVTDALQGMADRLMSIVKNATAGYEPAFQIGVYEIAVVTDGDGRIIKRGDIDLEECFNNACTARNSLENSDDSGIAYFDQVMVEEQKWINTVHERQQAALDNGEFLVYYQPKYDPSTDKLRGAEALIRWQSPELGFVTPNRFIPIFEKNGFITQIDHYMLRRVAADQKRWLEQGLKCVPVSVNVSRIHFSEPDLAEQIRDIVDQAGTPHVLIEIELTESAFFDDKKAMLHTIQKLKEYGFSVSMDDFGSGYSSLNSLKDMPLDVLKLDAEFFRGDHVDDRGRIVVAEAIKLAGSLNMRTVAEGVEAKEQVEFLADLGCDMIQGYYYAKPMPATDYEKTMGT